MSKLLISLRWSGGRALRRPGEGGGGGALAWARRKEEEDEGR